VASRSPLNRFLASFVLPLVAGGRLEVRGLFGPGMLARFTEDRLLDGTLVAEVTTHMRAHLARVGPVGAIDLLPYDGIGLATVWHNLLAMTHPEATGRSGLRRRVREWSLAMLEWVGVPRSSHEVATRHAMLARLGEVGRVDTDVEFWAGSARYVGVAPPARLVAWRSLRRVRETKTRVGFFELLQELRAEEPEESLLECAHAALALSPLTDIALLDRPPHLPFRWSPATINALGDSALRGAASRLVLARHGAPGERGDGASARVKVLEQATQQAVGSGLPAPAAQLLVAFHLELLVAEALGRGAAPPAGHALAWDAVARLGSERTARITGLEPARLERALGLDLQSREPLKEAPAAALLARAGFLEVTT
jgi:hypothetical protein